MHKLQHANGLFLFQALLTFSPLSVALPAKKIREIYESYSSYEELINVAMGKQVLKALAAWLNDDKKLNLSVRDVLNSLELADIPEEVTHMLEALRSNAAKPSPEGMPKIPPEETSDEERGAE